MQKGRYRPAFTEKEKQRIRRLRDKHGLSLAILSTRFDSSPSTIQRVLEAPS